MQPAASGWTPSVGSLSEAKRSLDRTTKLRHASERKSSFWQKMTLGGAVGGLSSALVGTPALLMIPAVVAAVPVVSVLPVAAAVVGALIAGAAGLKNLRELHQQERYSEREIALRREVERFRRDQKESVTQFSNRLQERRAAAGRPAPPPKPKRRVEQSWEKYFR